MSQFLFRTATSQDLRAKREGGGGREGAIQYSNRIAAYGYCCKTKLNNYTPFSDYLEIVNEILLTFVLVACAHEVAVCMHTCTSIFYCMSNIDRIL